MTFQLSKAGFFKVSFLSLGASVVLSNKLIEGGLGHVLDLIMGVGLGTLARLSEGLLDSVGKGTDLSIDLGIGVGDESGEDFHVAREQTSFVGRQG